MPLPALFERDNGFYPILRIVRQKRLVACMSLRRSPMRRNRSGLWFANRNQREVLH
jgi:hypothetical protein